MTKSKAARRRERRNRANSRRRANRGGGPSAAPQEEKKSQDVEATTPEPDPEFPPISEIREGMEPSDLLAVVEGGIDEQRSQWKGGAVLEAAETAALNFVASKTQQGLWPTDVIMVTVYTKKAQFGPFPVDVAVTVDALVTLDPKQAAQQTTLGKLTELVHNMISDKEGSAQFRVVP